jgi:hypothetical protein
MPSSINDVDAGGNNSDWPGMGLTISLGIPFLLSDTYIFLLKALGRYTPPILGWD